MSDLMRDRVTLIKPDGQRFPNIRASVQTNKIFTDYDPKFFIEEGDIFERTLPNGPPESYLVTDRGFWAGSGGIPSRYQSKVQKILPTTNRAGSKVFIVHGHNEGAREAVARFVGKLDLEPIILHEQVNAGKTIIEKLEQYSDAAFAIVLLTPDDIGAKKSDNLALKPRARQNVILELGYCMGKLGRHHVAALVQDDDIEKPSDYEGMAYISMDRAGAWKMPLAKELKAAGLNVDLNKTM